MLGSLDENLLVPLNGIVLGALGRGGEGVGSLSESLVQSVGVVSDIMLVASLGVVVVLLLADVLMRYSLSQLRRLLFFRLVAAARAPAAR
jgi:hypothetical protein